MNFLFDLYGTLLDIRTDEQSDAFWEKIGRRLGASPEVRKEYAALCRRQAESLPEGAEIDLLAVLKTLMRAHGAAGDPDGFARAFRADSREKLAPFPRVREMLAALSSKGAGVYLLSNAQACFTFEELRMTGLADLFDGILLSSEAGWKKPSVRFFECAFERFGLSPKDCVYVGNDLRDDVGGAHGAGMRCVYIETEQSGRYDEAETPDYRVFSFRELGELLLSLA